jgi:hypothetical protein
MNNQYLIYYTKLMIDPLWGIEKIDNYYVILNLIEDKFQFERFRDPNSSSAVI